MNNKKKLLAISLIVLFLLIGGGITYYVYQLQQFRGDVRQKASETQGDWIGSATCSLSFAVATPTTPPTATPTDTPSATPTNTPSPECNSICEEPSDCPDDLICHEGNCRLESNPSSESCVEPTNTPTEVPTATNTPTEAPTATPVPECNDSCTQGDQCPSSLVCYIGDNGTGNCRLASNPSSTTCSQPTTPPTATTAPTQAPNNTPTNTPVPQTLPDAGISLPGLAVFGGGLILAIVGILLAL